MTTATHNFDQLCRFARNKMAVGTERYGNTILYVVFKTIEKNPNITVNQLFSHLCEKHFYDRASVSSALSVLVSDFGSVRRRVATPKRSEQAVSHLVASRPDRRPVEFAQLLSELESNMPELNAFSAYDLAWRNHGETV